MYLYEAYKLISSKTVHSRLGAEFKKIREKYASHYSKKSSNKLLRDDLNHLSKNKMKECGTKTHNNMKNSNN